MAGHASGAKAMVLGGVAWVGVGAGDAGERSGNMAVHLGGFDGYVGSAAAARWLAEHLGGVGKYWGIGGVGLVVAPAGNCSDAWANS